MSKNLPVPPELQHLIEKREREDDRRKAKGASRDVGSSAPSTGERRKKVDRRRASRKKSR
jgi:hypothetical protein